MKKNIYIITAVVIIIGIIFLVLDKDKFTISDIGWNYNKGIFNVSFSVHNETKSELSNKLVIRAYKDKYIGKAIVTDLIGEKRISATLLPGEKKKIKEKMNLTLGLSPDKVLVSAIEEK